MNIIDMSAPTLIFDLDDTLGNLRDPMSKALSHHSGVNVNWTEWHEFNILPFYNLSLDKFYDIIIQEDLLNTMEPYNETEETLTRIKDNGYNIVIVTSRAYHPDAKNLTEKWFDKYGLPYDEIIISDHGKEKIDYVSKYEKLLMFVDDRRENCEAAKKSGLVDHTYIYDMPWNKNSDIQRINNLKELYTHL